MTLDAGVSGESALDRIRRLRGQNLIGEQTDPTGPVGPTGPIGPGDVQGYDTVQSPDARDRNTTPVPPSYTPQSDPNAVGPMGPQGPGTTGSASDKYTLLQTLGSAAAAPSVQTPDAQQRNIEMNNPAPPGFHWENGRLKQDAGTTTIQPDPTGTTPTGNTIPGTGSSTAVGTGKTIPTGTGTGTGTGTTVPGTGGTIQQPGSTITGNLGPTGDTAGGNTGAGGDTGGDTGAGSGTGNVGTGPGGTGKTGDITGNILGQLAAIQNEINNNSPADVGLLYAQSLQSLLAMIGQEEAAARAEAEKAGTSLDPATEFTLTKMREELDRQLKQSQMALNARGLYDSGILVQTENDLRKGNMSDQAAVLSTRLSKIQEDLQSSLRSLRERKLSAAQTYGLEGAGAQVDENNRVRSRGDQLRNMLLGGTTNLRGQLSDEANAEANRQASAREAEASRQQRLAEIRLGNEFTASQNDLNRQAEMQRALLNARSGGGSTGTGSTTRPPGTSATTGQRIVYHNDGTTNLGDQAYDALMGSYNDGAEAAAAIAAAEEQMRQDGLTPADLLRLKRAAGSLPNFGGYAGDSTGVTHGR